MSTRSEPATNNLAEVVLPLIRTRAELYRRGAANGHGQQMHAALDILESAIPTADAGEVYSVTHEALASAIKVIAHYDDSDGIIGDVCRRLLDLHPKVALAANLSPVKLVDWMVRFQFEGEVDYFTLDPVTYAAALGEAGMTAYRSRLTTIADGLGPQPTTEQRWTSNHSHEWFTLDWNARRLAVGDHDIDAIIRTHARDRRVAAWFEDTARALEEISEIDLAIDWAKQATDFDRAPQSRRAADYWGELIDQHRPQKSLEARLIVFRRWPSSTTAARLHAAAGTSWPDYHDEVFAALSVVPSDAVLFVLLTLDDVEFAWSLAHSLTLDSDSTWSRLIDAYEKVDPLGVIPIHRRLLERELVVAGAKHYRSAGRRLMRMRKLTAGTEVAREVDALIADLREVHRRRPRLQQEFDRAGLP